MATVSDQKTLDCSMCFKTFISPRVLPCSHTFCEECLCTHIESHVQGGAKFMCPLCAAPTVPSDSSLAIDKWSRSFPLNKIINSLLESTKHLNTSDAICGQCETEGETSTAEFWCIECREQLCHSCYKSHKRVKLLKHHQMVPINEKNKSLNSSIDFNQECGRHRDKMKELFCIDHRELCCPLCVATEHRQCKDVRSIDDITRDQSQRYASDYPSIIRDFRKLKKEMEKIMNEKKTKATQVLQEKNEILHDIENKIYRIIAHLNKLKNAFRNETDQLYQDTKKAMVQNETNVRSFLTNIDNSSEILEVADKIGTLQQKFTTFEHLRTQIISHYDQLNIRLKDDVEVHLTLKASKFLNDLEETWKSVGSVEVSKKSSTMSRDALQSASSIMKNLNSRIKIGSEMAAAQVEKLEDLMTSPVTFVKAVTRYKVGRSTWFTGGTFLGNGRLVMSDRNNSRLVELDDEYNVVKEYKIDGRPTDVAAGNNDNEIYIAVDKSYIYKCTLDTDLTIVSMIKAPSDTWGIAVSGDNIIVGTRDAVVIPKQDGSTVRSIPKSGGDSYVAVSKKQRTIYHRDNDDVVRRTWEGQEVFRYQHQQLEYPSGMCTDRYKNVYICGRDSHNLHQVSHDGQRGRIIQLKNITEPLSVSLHSQKNQLIVTSLSEDTVCEIYKCG